MSNRELPAKKFAAYLARQHPSLVAFEACGRAHHWARKARELGHEAVLLPPKIVASFRQGHKIDGKDALAIGTTARHPEIKPAAIMSLEQQSLQSDLRVQQHLSDQLTATGNLLRGLLAEFGIEIRQGIAALKKHLPLILEDAENGLPMSVRKSLNQAWLLWQTQATHLQALEKLLARRFQAHEACQQLTQLESVGVKNAIGLYVELGDARHFNHERNAAACFGLTPKQHSRGGKVKISSIGKYCGNQHLRASLILGAHPVLNQLAKREARTDKERWLKALIARRGEDRAAVALANKTVRTAWAMLYYNEPYKGSLTLAS